MVNVVICLNYNDFETTKKFIEMHINNENVSKIVVVDNDSTDDSYGKLKKYESIKVDVIKTEYNGGYAYGNNFGANYAIKKYRPDYITVANPDTVISDDTLEKVLSIYKNKKDAAVCSCIMNSNASFHTTSAWKQPTYLDCLVACINGVKNLFRWHVEYPEEFFQDENATIREVDVIAGSFFCIKRNVFEDIDGFDTNTFLYYEEAILSARVQEKGYRNYLATDVCYLHDHSVSVTKNISSIGSRLDILQRSRVYYCREYLKINLLQLLLLKSAYLIGKYMYLLYLSTKRGR